VNADAGDTTASNEDAKAARKGDASRAHTGRKASSANDGPRPVPAGRVGRAHGLDGSFYVTGARPRLLAADTAVTLSGHTAPIVRRAGTDEHPIIRLEGIGDRLAAEALRGLELTVDMAVAPALDEGEWWAQELEGCEVVDGGRHVGTVIGLMELPSCEALEVRLTAPDASSRRKSATASAGELLVPMVREAIRSVDPVRRRIDVSMDFLGDL
jgi:16S rRNA processing protein RimM